MSKSRGWEDVVKNWSDNNLLISNNYKNNLNDLLLKL